MPKLIVANSQGKTLRDLSSSGIAVGEVVGVGDTPGPVTFIAGGLMRREQNPPFFFAGDNGSVPNPWAPVAGSVIRVQAVAGPEQTLLDMTFPVHAPPPPPPPPITVLRVIGPHTGPGNGITNADAIDLHIISYEQNICLIDGKPHTIRNVISEKAYTRSRQVAIFKGQGLLIENPDQPHNTSAVTVEAAAFLDNGFSKNYDTPPDVPVNPHWKGMFWHGVYVNRFGQITFKRCIFGNNANCGAKIMRNALFDECLFLHNSIGSQVLYDPVTFRNCVWYRSSWYWDGGSRDIGRLGLDVYSPVTLENPLFIDGPKSTWADPLENPMDLGLMKLNRSHTQYTDTPGGRIDSCTNGLAYNWPLSSDGKMFSGDAWQGGQSLAGLTVRSGPVITYDETGIIEKMRKNQVSVEDACATIMGDLRKLVA